MLLTLVKYKLILLTVLFSTPVFSQIYGTTESTNDCPDCCKKPPKPPVCIQTGTDPSSCPMTEPKPICEKESIELKKLGILSGQEYEKAQIHHKNMQKIINAKSNAFDDKQKFRREAEALRDTVRQILRHFQYWYPNALPHCLTQDFYPAGRGGQARAPCPKMCGDSSGGVKKVDYFEHAIGIASQAVPCADGAVALLEAVGDPNAATVYQASVSVIENLVDVGPVAAVCKDIGTSCTTGECPTETASAVCDLVRERLQEKPFELPTFKINPLSCLNVTPASLAISVAFKVGALIADINSCQQPMTWMSFGEWIKQARALADVYDRLEQQMEDALEMYDQKFKDEKTKHTAAMAEYARLSDRYREVSRELLDCRRLYLFDLGRQKTVEYSKCK